MTLKNKFESEAYAIQSGDIGSLKTAIIKSLNAVAPFKKRIVRGNNKPHLTSLIRKEIMARSRLENKANKSGKEEDLKAYKKQRNLVLKLNRKAKKNFLKNCISTNDKMKNKTFWKLCKPFFTEKGSQYNQNIKINQNKSTSGTIPAKVLRSVAKEICIPFTDCINSAILNGKFPSELKMADVIPIFKKDDPFEKANYRPISLLPSLSKVYEKFIYQQLNSFFENKLSLLCGFRSRYITQHALLNLINKWHSCLDNSGVVDTILMDLSKAFGCLLHELVLSKLHAYGVYIKSLKLLQDYLSNRTQRVKLDSTFSSWLKILLGVPQGSILDPLLFNIFLNDMLWFVEKTDICNFADGNTIYSCAKSVNDVIENLQSDLKVVLKWFQDNQMMANPGKFQFMILSKNTINKSIVIGNKTIESSKSVKLLGLTIYNKLNFGIHINNICKVASAKIKGLGRIRNRINLSQAKILYNFFLFCFSSTIVALSGCSVVKHYKTK